MISFYEVCGKMETNIRLSSVLEKQKKRYELLHKIYELTDGDESKMIQLEIPENLDRNEVQSIIDYLSGEGLVESLADEGLLLSITHRGVVELEKSLVNPKESTEHFPTQVIQHFHGLVGSVQTGNQNVANVTQSISVGADVSELLRQLRQHITDETPEKQQDGIELLEGLESEIKTPNQSKSRIKLYLKGLGSFVKDTGKDLLVEISSKLISNQLGLPS
jgi:predicted transcriptional regulator